MTSNQFKAGTTYAIAPTIEEIVRECDEAWATARKLRADFGAGADDEKAQDSIYLSIVREHAELNKTYPVILAAMAAGSYNQRAVRKFFRYVKDHPWHSQEEFMDVQSAYNSILFRQTHSHTNQKVVAQIRAQTRDALAENERAMKEQVERATREAEENNRRHAKGRCADMLARVPRDAAIIVHGEVRPLTIIFDGDQ